MSAVRVDLHCTIRRYNLNDSKQSQNEVTGMLKRVAISTAILMALTAPPLLAEQEKEFQNWAAGFVQWYNADSDKPSLGDFSKPGQV